MPHKKKSKAKKALALQPDTREVKRIHTWKPGTDPNDPDAQQGSGWEYIKLSGDYETDTRDKRDKYKKGGGPESGCPCMHCGDMTRIVDEVSALTIIEQDYQVTDPEKRKQLLNEKVAILLCPKCESITQFRADVIQDMRRRWVEKNA